LAKSSKKLKQSKIERKSCQVSLRISRVVCARLCPLGGKNSRAQTLTQIDLKIKIQIIIQLKKNCAAVKFWTDLAQICHVSGWLHFKDVYFTNIHKIWECLRLDGGDQKFVDRMGS